MNVEHRTLNVQHRTSNECILSILKKISRHAAQAPALRERFHPSKFDIRYSIFCGSLFNPGHPSDPSNHQETVPFWPSFIREVSGVRGRR